MSVLSHNGERWVIDYELVPVEFWPYTTNIRDKILAIPRDQIDYLQAELVKAFCNAGIGACVDNKTVYGLKDDDGKMWYFGFKDYTFYLGTSIGDSDYNKPITFQTTKKEG